MRRGFSFVIAALLVTAVSCASQPAVDTEAARAALREADAGYSKAGAAKDRGAFLAFYATDAVIYPPGEATLTGREAMGTYMDTFLKDPAFALSFKPGTVEVSTDGTMGYTFSDADITVTGPDGNPMTERVRDFHVWRKQADGSWKLVVDIWNAESAPGGSGN